MTITLTRCRAKIHRQKWKRQQGVADRQSFLQRNGKTKNVPAVASFSKVTKRSGGSPRLHKTTTKPLNSYLKRVCHGMFSILLRTPSSQVTLNSWPHWLIFTSLVRACGDPQSLRRCKEVTKSHQRPLATAKCRWTCRARHVEPKFQTKLRR